jgi:hypothetical protein
MGSLPKLKAVDTRGAASKHQSLQERIEALSHRIEYRRMVDFEDREAVYHLRRKAYARNNSDIEEWAAEAIDDPHEDNSDTVGLFIDSRLVGSVKVTVATQSSPNCQSRTYAPEAVDKLLESGGVVIDPGRLVADVDAARDFPELPYLLLRVAMVAVQYFEAKYCLSLVNKRHSPFYGRVFKAVPIAGPVWCEPLKAELMLMAGDVEQDLEAVLQRFPFWRASYLEMRQMFGPIDAWECITQRRLAAA